MPKYKVYMTDGHELTIEAPNWGHAVELALREHPGQQVTGYNLVPEDATGTTDSEPESDDDSDSE